MSLGNVHITPQLVQAVRDAIDIVDIASDHTRIQKAGHRYKGLCPLHKEKTPSFSVDPTQGLYYCFGCGKGGDAIGLHMELTGDDFPGAIEALANRYGIPLPTRSERPDKDRPPDLRPVLEAAQKLFVRELGNHAEPQRYLHGRKISPELAAEYGLGYAPDAWEHLYDALRFDFPVEQLEAAGLTGRRRSDDKPYDRFRNRLMFPIRNPAGRLVGFGGRTLGDDKAKYINTSETQQFHKGSLLYGLDRAKKTIRETSRAVLVEGYFDVLGAAAAGVEGVVAGMGTALTPTQAKLLARYAEEVILGYDGDEAGENAARRALGLLLAEGLTVRRARFGAGEDPDSLRLAAGPEAVRTAVADAADLLNEELERLTPPEAIRDPRLQARHAKEVAEVLAPIPDQILRFGYARRAADRLGVPPEMLSRRVESAAAVRGSSRRSSGRPADRSPAPGRPTGPPPGHPAAPPPDAVPAPVPGPPPPPGGGNPVPGGSVESRAPVTPGADRRDSGSVPSLEDEVLVRLLDSGGEPPPLDRLPPAEVFFDPVSRNIYRVLHDLYERDGGLPAARAVVEALGGDAEAVSRVARYQNAHEYPPGCRRLGLWECIDHLSRRWRKERLRDLTRQIHEAQRRQDGERLDALLEEKQQLSRSLHRAIPGGPGTMS
jgi:DNA primase